MKGGDSPPPSPDLGVGVLTAESLGGCGVGRAGSVTDFFAPDPGALAPSREARATCCGFGFIDGSPSRARDERKKGRKEVRGRSGRSLSSSGLLRTEDGCPDGWVTHGLILRGLRRNTTP